MHLTATFRFIEAENMTLLYMDNSTADDVRVESLTRLEASRSSVIKRFSGTVTQETVTDGSFILLNDAVLKGGLHANNCSIKTVS